MADRVGLRWLRGQLPELIAAGMITAETAAEIERHCANEEKDAHSLAFLSLAILGSGLIAAGVILLIAHNWDELSRSARSIIAFLPLLCAQGFAVFVLLRRAGSKPWRESAAIFDIAAVGTAIALVSQTYQIQGTLDGFLLVWLLLALPVFYLFESAAGAAVYFCGAISWLIARDSHFAPTRECLWIWPLLLAGFPYLFLVWRRTDFGCETQTLGVFAHNDSFVTVRVFRGQAALEDLYLDGQPIAEYLRAPVAK